MDSDEWLSKNDAAFKKVKKGLEQAKNREFVNPPKTHEKCGVLGCPIRGFRQKGHFWWCATHLMLHQAQDELQRIAKDRIALATKHPYMVEEFEEEYLLNYSQGKLDG